MTHYLLGLGSNINPDDNLPKAIIALANITQVVTVSPIVHTQAEGNSFNFPFQNQLVLVRCSLKETELKQQLLDIEVAMGREPKCEARKFKDRTIDIDILGTAQSEAECLQYPLDESYYLSVQKQWQQAPLRTTTTSSSVA